MMSSYASTLWWCVTAILLLSAAPGRARPQAGSDSESWQPVPSGHRVNRPLLWTDESIARESKSEEKVHETKSVNVSATATVSENNKSNNVGRKAGTTTATPIGESLRTVTKQLLRAPPTDMVATDIRTPPKIKNKITEEFVPLGKGEAIPVVLDDSDAYETIVNTQNVKTATADPSKSSGISTWILLNGSEQSTQATQKKQQVKPIASPAVIANTAQTKKKPAKDTDNVSNSPENIKKVNNSSTQKSEIKPVTSSSKQNDSVKKQQTSTGKEELLTKIPATLLQDAKFRNKTPVIVGKIPSSGNRNKTDAWNVKKKVTATIVPVSNTESSSVTTPTTIKRKPSPTQPTPTVTTTTKETAKPAKPAQIYHYELVPTTSVILQSDIVDADTTEELVTTEEPSTTTRRTRKPGTKKKKKNKNRRRRPAKKPEGVIESKITEDNATKIHSGGPSRPLSTRIYNYLAREVMPSVGVGLVGLVLTAGLAGLFLYPFGGAPIARRRYDKVPGPSPDGHMYYYNDYSSSSEVDNGQPEESIFGQVLAGMTQSENKFGQYGSRPSTQYAQPNKYRYDQSHDYTYASNGYKTYNKDKYSDTSSRNPDTYSTLTDTTGHNSKYTTSVGATGNTQYTDTKYSSSLGSSGNSQYTDTKYSPSLGSTGNSQYTDTKYSPSLGTAGNSQYADTKYSSLVGTSVSSKYTDSKYSSPVSTSSSDSSNTKYSTLTGISIEPQSSKYSSSQSTDYQPVGEYTAYSDPSDVGTHGEVYKSSSADIPKYSDIEYDETKDSSSLIEEDKSNKNQPTFAALHSNPYHSASYPKVDSMIPITGNYNKEVRHRQGVVAIEHGPRNIKIQRKKRDAADNNSNEVDSILPKDDLNKIKTTTDENNAYTTTENIPTTVVLPTTTENSGKSESISDKIEPTTKKPDVVVSSTVKPFDEDNTFMGFLRRLAQIKLRIGLDLLKSTTQVVARYFDSMQKKMESAVKALENRGNMYRRMKRSDNKKTK